MKTIATLAVLLLATAPAFAQSVGEKSGANSLLGVTPSTADFVLQASQSDMFEIKSSELAGAQSDKVKDFAQKMVEAHKETTSQLTSAIGSGTTKLAMPTDMSSSQMSMLDDLKARKGDDLADQYIDDQVSAHKDAVSLFQRYADGGEDPKLKAWAAKTLPDLKHHLEMAQAMDK